MNYGIITRLVNNVLTSGFHKKIIFFYGLFD